MKFRIKKAFSYLVLHLLKHREKQPGKSFITVFDK